LFLFFRERFPVFTVETLVEILLVFGVLSLSHHGTPHTIGAKRLNLGFCVWSIPFSKSYKM